MKIYIYNLISAFQEDNWELFNSDDYLAEDGSACFDFRKDGIVASLFFRNNEYDQLITYTEENCGREQRHETRMKSTFPITGKRLAMLPQAMKDKINEP